jgi:hypothetical protein
LLTLEEKSRPRIFENRALRRVFGARGTRKRGSVKDYITRNFMICTPYQILYGWSNQDD